jgi:hypothetical protein
VQEIAVERVETMEAAGVSDNAVDVLPDKLSDRPTDSCLEELAGCEVQECKRVTPTPKNNKRKQLFILISKCLRNNRFLKKKSYNFCFVIQILKVLQQIISLLEPENRIFGK